MAGRGARPTLAYFEGGSDRRFSNRAAAKRCRNLQGSAMARGELRLAVSATSPNGADGVNDVPRSEPSGARRLGVTGLAAAQQAALREQLRPGRAVDRTVDSAPTEEARVRSVDDRVDVLLRDIPANGLDHRRNASLTPVTRDSEPQLDPDDRPPICPACGVTQGIVMDGDQTEFVCLECGFSETRDPASYEREA
jgi:hypothetical protein